MTIQPGTIFQCGRHRLMCGDSTSRAHVLQLIHGAHTPDSRVVNALITSPPYGQQRTYAGTMASNWLTLMQHVFSSAVPCCREDAQLFVNLGLFYQQSRVSRYFEPWLTWMDEMGWRTFGWYVWDKGSPLPVAHQGRLWPCFEFVFHLNRTIDRTVYPAKWVRKQEASQRKWTSKGQRNADGRFKGHLSSPTAVLQPYRVPDDVLRIRRANTSGTPAAGHPAPYPVELPTHLMLSYTHPGHVVYDPFAGSGTTMMACEALQRVCYSMELVPDYVALTLTRWEETTGIPAIMVQ